MNNEDLKIQISQYIPAASYDESGEFLNAFLPLENFAENMLLLRQKLQLDYLFCLTAIDWKDHIAMVYHLLSKQQKHTLVIKVKITDTANPTMDSVCGIWKTANYHEREVYDMFGVHFNAHPDLRRIFLDEDWKGWPLRKNYEDENMIAL
jgi:NADH/F420H2 dehydrogenase subunit C